MSDRFASLKSNNTFKKSNDKRTPPPQKTNSRFDNLNEKKSNRFSYKSKDRRFNNRRDNRRDNRIDNRIDNRSNNFPGNIGKFTQVGTGEVSFVPQIKCGSNSQKDRKKEREMKKADQGVSAEEEAILARRAARKKRIDSIHSDIPIDDFSEDAQKTLIHARAARKEVLAQIEKES